MLSNGCRGELLWTVVLLLIEHMTGGRRAPERSDFYKYWSRNNNVAARAQSSFNKNDGPRLPVRQEKI